MHCPKCGHQQTDDSIRFCTRCGLALGQVKDLLAPQEGAVKVKNNSKTGRGVRQGLGLFIFGLLLITVLAILRDMDIVPQIFIKIAALIFCIGGAARMAFPFIYGEDRRQKPDYDGAVKPTPAIAGAANNLLPQSPATVFVTPGAENYSTNDLGQPASVTDNTTRRLGKQFEQPE
jgi:hypothetical protein